MKKYLADSTMALITPIEIMKETETSVYLPNQWYPNGQRYDKTTGTRGYFDTWEEARDFLVCVEETKIATLTRELARRQKNIEKIQGMQP